MFLFIPFQSILSQIYQKPPSICKRVKLFSSSSCLFFITFIMEHCLKRLFSILLNYVLNHMLLKRVHEIKNVYTQPPVFHKNITAFWNSYDEIQRQIFVVRQILVLQKGYTCLEQFIVHLYVIFREMMWWMSK